MKKMLFICTILLLSLSASAQGYPSLIDSDYETITLNITGYGQKEPEALIDAQMNALRNVLFIGVPGAKRPTKIIAQSEAGFLAQNPDFMKNIENSYTGFIMNCTKVGKLTKYSGKTKQIKAIVKVNIKALAQYANQNGGGFGL